MDLKNDIIIGNYDREFEEYSKVSEEGIGLLQKLLCVDPFTRFDAR